MIDKKVNEIAESIFNEKKKFYSLLGKKINEKLIKIMK